MTLWSGKDAQQTAPLSETQQSAAETIGRALWHDAYRQQSPEASKEDRAASWKQNRVAYLHLGRVAVRHLLKAGHKL